MKTFVKLAVEDETLLEIPFEKLSPFEKTTPFPHCPKVISSDYLAETTVRPWFALPVKKANSRQIRFYAFHSLYLLRRKKDQCIRLFIIYPEKLQKLECNQIWRRMLRNLGNLSQRRWAFTKGMSKNFKNQGFCFKNFFVEFLRFTFLFDITTVVLL